MAKISIVVPCYNEAEVINIFYDELKKIQDELKIDFEVIFVDDGSKDKTLDLIREVSLNKGVRYISFSRNFGKEAAMLAGLKAATGEYVAVMDADLQDPPYLLKEMYNILKEGEYDSVATRRVSRKGEPIIRSFFARIYYKIINKVSKTEIVDGARDYRLMTRQMVNSVLEVTEYNRFSKGIFSWVGYNTKWLEYENVERVAGTTSWSFFRLFLYSLESIVAFSTLPLLIASIFGILFCFIAFIIIVIIIIKTLVIGDPTSGWPSMACIMFFIGGIQLLCTGIIGQYLAKTYLEVKKRPIYIIKETEKTKK
ncbi:MAG: glycosyltransferase family 2 protein [Bacilli bacterium]|nr:glycosyltransferase family 2 protein [Bacilli bacterium]